MVLLGLDHHHQMVFSTKMSILGGAWWSYMRLTPRFRVFGEFNYVPKPTKFYITTLVAFCFREEAPSWVFVDYPGEAGVESKLSGDKKLFLFLPPAPQPVVRIQRWGGNLPPGFVFAQQSCIFSSQDVLRLASFKISEYLHKFVQLFGGVKKRISSLPAYDCYLCKRPIFTQEKIPRFDSARQLVRRLGL